LCRQAARISRRSSARLRASPPQFGTHGEPRAPSPLLTFLLHPGAPSDILQFFCFTANRGVEPHLHLTIAWSHSGWLSSVLLDALDLSDHADEVVVNARAPSTSSAAPGSPRTPSTTTSWPQPRRRRLLRRAETLGEPHLSQISPDPSDQDPKDPVRTLTEPTRADLNHPIHLRSNGLKHRSDRIGTSQ
jgi:hypothetical protein